jgi:hypothetical protein
MLLLTLTTKAINSLEEIPESVIRVVSRVVSASLPLCYVFRLVPILFLIDTEGNGPPNLRTRPSNLEARNVVLGSLRFEHLIILSGSLGASIPQYPLEGILFITFLWDVAGWTRTPAEELVNQHLPADAVVICWLPIIPLSRLYNLLGYCLSATLLPCARVENLRNDIV